MPSPAPKLSPADLIQQEVAANILNQPLGHGTVADLGLPREFVARIADRVTRASFNERHRIVVPNPAPPRSSPAPRAGGVMRVFERDGGGVPGSPSLPGVREELGCLPHANSQSGQGDHAETPRSNSGPTLQVLDRPLSREALRARQLLLESRPANRAFRAGDDPATFNTPTPLPPPDLANFKPTIPNFQLLPDDGTHAPRLLRLQLTRGTDYAAPGDGGSLDMLRHVAAALPSTPLLVSVERKHLADARTACEGFAAARPAPITLIVEDLPVAQWAHDNGKPGLADGQPFTLLPRYASRGEDGSVFVPGESFLHEGLAAAGVRCRRSPLLFQGGNMIAFHSPSQRDGAVGRVASSFASALPSPTRRSSDHESTLPTRSDGVPRTDLTLLLGEAEVARNTALGLSRDQVLAAFQSEFGVARIVVLPAISYHIDLEVSIRRLADGTSIALVNDQPAAVRIILHAAISALERGAHINPARGFLLRQRLDRGPMNEFLLEYWSNLAKFSTRQGHVLESSSPVFSTGPADSGVGNLHRVLLALDLLAAELPAASNLDPHAAALLASIARREQERRRLRSQLQSLGLKVASIPSLSDADRGLNYLNGFHSPNAFFMPTYGGFFDSLDRAASAAILSAIGPSVRVLSIPSAESQRREGAVRCATAIVC